MNELVLSENSVQPLTVTGDLTYYASRYIVGSYRCHRDSTPSQRYQPKTILGTLVNAQFSGRLARLVLASLRTEER